MASVFFGGKFFQSLNKSLVQVLIKQLGAHILKYIHADFEKAAVGGLMDHVSLDHVSLNVHQINSDLILHQIPFQVAYGTIKKLEINLYLAHAQLHIIVTGLRIGISPHYSSSLLFSLDNYFYDESHLTSQGGRKGVGGGGSAARTTAGAGPSSEQEHSSSSSSSSAPGAPPGAGGFGPSGGGGSGLVPSSYSGGISNFISSSLTSSILGGGGGAGAGQKGKGFFSGALGSFGGGGAGGGGSGGSTSGSSSSSGASPHGVDASQNVNRDSILLLLPREVYDSQVGKIKSHVKTCENRLRRESLRKQIERVDRLIQHLQQQLADRAPGASTAEALRSAIERHKAEALALQEQMKDSVLTDGDSNEFQPLLQWFVRYMPNIKIRIDDVRIDFEDLKDTVHPMRCGLKVSRILLQPQPQGLWQVNWPKRQDDETNADDSSTTTRTNVSNSSSRDRQTTSAASVRASQDESPPSLGSACGLCRCAFGPPPRAKCLFLYLQALSVCLLFLSLWNASTRRCKISPSNLGHQRFLSPRSPHTRGNIRLACSCVGTPPRSREGPVDLPTVPVAVQGNSHSSSCISCSTDRPQCDSTRLCTTLCRQVSPRHLSCLFSRALYTECFESLFPL